VDILNSDMIVDVVQRRSPKGVRSADEALTGKRWCICAYGLLQWGNACSLGGRLYCKGTGHRRTDHEGPEKDWRYNFTLSLPSALDEGGRSTPRPCLFAPWKHPVPIVLEVEWPSGPVWTGAENFGTVEIRSPDRSARNESLNVSFIA